MSEPVVPPSAVKIPDPVVVVPSAEPSVPPAAVVPTGSAGPVGVVGGSATAAPPEDALLRAVAETAALGVPGVHSVGGVVRREVSGAGAGPVGPAATAVEVSLVVEYGVSIRAVTEQVRRQVLAAVETGTHVGVDRVDVAVTDVHRSELVAAS